MNPIKTRPLPWQHWQWVGLGNILPLHEVHKMVFSEALCLLASCKLFLNASLTFYTFLYTLHSYIYIYIYIYIEREREREREKSLSPICLFATPWAVAYQSPLSMEFSRQEYWSGLPFPSPEDLPDPGIEPRSPTLQADASLSEPTGRPHTHICIYLFI